MGNIWPGDRLGLAWLGWLGCQLQSDIVAAAAAVVVAATTVAATVAWQLQLPSPSLFAVAFDFCGHNYVYDLHAGSLSLSSLSFPWLFLGFSLAFPWLFLLAFMSHVISHDVGRHTPGQARPGRDRLGQLMSLSLSPSCDSRLGNRCRLSPHSSSPRLLPPLMALLFAVKSRVKVLQNKRQKQTENCRSNCRCPLPLPAIAEVWIVVLSGNLWAAAAAAVGSA